MYRNTYLLVSSLAVFAALLIGVNIGRRFQAAESGSASPSSFPETKQSVGTSNAVTKSYVNAFCKIGFDYPETLTVLENASGSAAFSGKNADEGILLTCQKNIPLPNVSLDAIEPIKVGSVAANLYHIQTASDGATMDSLIFRHPTTNLDVFLAGSGEVFRKLISSITLLP